jgi:hypothetical protein
VRFAGDGVGEGPLSWGQTENWLAILRQKTWLPLGGVMPLPAGTTVEALTEQLGYLMSRYPTLRTRLRLPDGAPPSQVVAAAGEVVLEVFDGDAHLAQQVHDRYRDTDLDFTTEWPVRMAVIRRDGEPAYLVSLISHFALDATAITVMFADAATRTPEPVTGQQPLDQAEWQRSPAGQRHNAAAMRHWERILGAIAPRRFTVRPERTGPRYWHGEFTSPDLRAAVRAIVHRTGVDSSTVLLALYVRALATVSGVDPVAVRLTSSNRFRAGLADVVCTLVQAGLLMVDTADAPFAQLLERTKRQALSAFKYAYFDPTGAAAVHERVARERGTEIELGCFYNDRRSAAREQEILDVGAPSPTTLEWLGRHDAPATEPLFVHVDDAPGTMRLTVQVDTDYVSPADVEALLRLVESTALAESLAAHPDM